MRLICTSLLLLILSSNILSAQNRVIDSLTNLINSYAKNDDHKAELLNALGNRLLYIDPNKSIHYLDQALKIGERTKNVDKNIMTSYLWKGIAYQNLSDFAKSDDYTYKALAIARKNNYSEAIGTAMGTLGLSAMNKGNFIKSLEHFQNASNYYREAKDPRELFMYNNMAVVYSQMKNFEKATEYFKIVLKGCIQRNDSNRIATTLLNIGTTLLDQKKAKEALPYLTSSIGIFERKNDASFLSRAYGNLGIAYKEINQKDSSVYFTKKAIDQSIKTNNKRSAAVQMSNLGNFYTDINKLTDAKPLLLEAYTVSQQLGFVDIKRDVSQNLSIYYEKAGSIDSAYHYYKQYITLNDSIVGSEAQNKLAKLELQYDYDRKADSLRFRNELTAVELLRQTLFAEQQQQKLLLTEKDRQLQKLLSFQRLSELQVAQQTNEEKAKQLHLANKEKQLQKAQIASLDKDNYLNRLRLRQQWFFSLGSILLLGGLGSFFIYRYNLKQSSLQADIAREKAEFETKMSNAALTSLRSQMNPHFIFNCLNSIRLFAAKNDSLSATNYISKFSRLMRLVLENSKSERISLQQEIETLQLYVDMELMRFKNKLKYDVHFQNGMDTQYIEVPPMIIQPYVENAIWHGLMHKEEGGKLNVEITEEDEILVVKVRDNGVGRAKAAELKAHSTGHKSFAMNITKERLDLLNEKYGTNASVSVNDLYENGNASGTEVTLKIPIL